MIATESSLARLAPTISLKLAFTFFLTLCASIFTLSALAQKVTIITFDPPGSVQTMRTFYADCADSPERLL
jgi:hypothetical protein